MILFQIHDNADGNLDWEETTWQAVWADSEEEAFALYCKAHDYCELGTADVVFSDRERLAAITPSRDEPHIECRPEVLRQLGWRVEGESTCDTCGLAAMDDERFRVCEECNQCLECGHDQDCELRHLEDESV